MAEKKSKSTASEAAPTRDDRLKSALKSNLAKRKAQARVRGETGKGKE